ncbi:hypothetical protein FM038_009080 [Shewanella eurypsychrophilus]|uniref:PilZ domain-containing protein n=1 Tax=Shewanella eurypsychrophilus TaxID=2593656 RepID=A0ABX6V5G4_9GAMM|nr:MULTISPECIES: hypothetical protein [Shewanella]QFU22295.1 hypothetical protein FS418_10660 [Shewanella sp. YLB-09]QPG57581.1 hypothetical protein FM038_009080 [Shewanella eurypsychrophilus]
MFTESTPYFSIKHGFSAYLSSWPKDEPLPTEDELRAMLPAGLLLISQVKSLEADCLIQLRHLDDDAKSVVDYLKLQSRKIDIVLQHVLEQEEHEGERFSGTHFGGSGISIISDSALNIGAQFKVSLHIKEELVALICFATVTASESITSELHPSHTQFNHVLEFTQILDTDVEQLVKASLSVQQKQLKLRKQAKAPR